MKLAQLTFLLLSILTAACKQKNTTPIKEQVITDTISVKNVEVEKPKIVKSLKARNILKAQNAPQIDGKNTDACWQNMDWQPLDQLWVGEEFSKDDFEGKYKLTWDHEALYLLVSITDDVLFDQYKDPKELWWDDDCVEIFIDADNSGGQHLDNHNAFAYHVALDHNVVDMSTTKEAILFNDHVKTQHITTENTTIWEHKIYLFEEVSFNENEKNIPLQLKENTQIGFALAYCDNDGSKERENFIGSVFVPGEDKNQGYINADIFETIQLVE